MFAMSVFIIIINFVVLLYSVQMIPKVTTGRIQGSSQTPSTNLKLQALNLIFLDIEM